MRQPERDSWIAQLEQERTARKEDRAHWQTELAAERVARVEAETEFSKTISALLERADRQEAAAREERAKLLDRIQAREPEREQEKPFYPPDGEVQEPPHTPEDLENYAHVGGIVPEGVKVGMDTPWPPPTYPQTPFANSEE